MSAPTTVYKAEHIEWMYREACTRHEMELRNGNGRKDPKWFTLAYAIEEAFPSEVKALRERFARAMTEELAAIRGKGE